MIKFTRRDITEYALYTHMKYWVTDFDVIFNGNKIISEIMHRYDLFGNFNSNVLSLFPLLHVRNIKSESDVNEWLNLITDAKVEEEFVQIGTITNGYEQVYYIKMTDIGE